MTPPSPQKPKIPKVPWALRLPPAFHVNSPLFILAAMVFITGIAALTGLSNPESITSQMSLPFYKIWGGILSLNGFFLGVAILRRDDLLEKYTARILSISLTAFALWAVIANGITRAFVSTMLIIVFVFLCEQRISLLNVLNYARKIADSQEEDQDGN